MKQNAFDLVAARGEYLVGRHINTAAVGEYPGGIAQIIELFPDLKGAPEIVLQVRNPTWATQDNPNGEIGVFEWEDVELIDLTAEHRCEASSGVLRFLHAEPCAQTSGHPSQQD
jgi:hypothetical protein